MTNFESLVGMDSLWCITFESENERARDESRELLVDLHLRLDGKYKPEARRGIMQGFIDRAMGILSETGKGNKEENTERKALNAI